jgi:D-mannonate dehydratase
MGEAKKKQEQFEQYVHGLRTNYKATFNSDDGKQVLSDLEKRCHFYHTTNIKGDSHESAYMEGQRSVLLFIKSMLQNDNEKGK